MSLTKNEAAEVKRLAEEYVDDAIYMENPERDSGVSICNYEASQKAFWAYIDSLTQPAPEATFQNRVAPWMLWDGTYEKKFYDVWVKEPHSNPPSGNDVVLACWPNAGKMVSTDGTGRKWNVEQVRAIRVSEWQAGPPKPPAAAIDSAMKE